MWIKYFKKNKFTGGYTIIETMIAVSVFLIVVVMGIGALLNVHLINKKSQSMRSIMDSLSFAMEDMSRNIRTGYNYHCIGSASNLDQPEDCINGQGQGIAFECGDNIACDTNEPNDQWVYLISGGKLFRSTSGDIVNDIKTQMTPDEIVLDEGTHNFSVIGSAVGDGQQPLVIIRLVGEITNKGVNTPFSLQTAVSQRLIDL